MSDNPKPTVTFRAVTPRQVLVASDASAPPIPRTDAAHEFDAVEEATEVGARIAATVALTRSARDRAVVTFLTGVHAGQVFPLEGAETIIGRARSAGLRIDEVGVSRQHSRVIRLESGAFAIEDMGSANGTFVCGRPVELRTVLAAGDRVQIGPNVVLQFSLVDAVEEGLALALYESSTRDALTQLFNRKHFSERLAAEVAYAQRQDTNVAALLLDIDHFKKTNDTHGHIAGDVVLRLVAAQLQKTIRVEDVLARYGGEEFVILARGIDHDKAAVFGERVRKGVEKLVVPWNAKKLAVTISVGVASLAQCGESATGVLLLRLADERLYKAKNAGRNRVCAH